MYDPRQTRSDYDDELDAFRTRTAVTPLQARIDAFRARQSAARDMTPAGSPYTASPFVQLARAAQLTAKELTR